MPFETWTSDASAVEKQWSNFYRKCGAIGGADCPQIRGGSSRQVGFGVFIVEDCEAANCRIFKELRFCDSPDRLSSASLAATNFAATYFGNKDLTNFGCGQKWRQNIGKMGTKEKREKHQKKKRGKQNTENKKKHTEKQEKQEKQTSRKLWVGGSKRAMVGPRRFDPESFFHASRICRPCPTTLSIVFTFFVFFLSFLFHFHIIIVFSCLFFQFFFSFSPWLFFISFVHSSSTCFILVYFCVQLRCRDSSDSFWLRPLLATF